MRAGVKRGGPGILFKTAGFQPSEILSLIILSSSGVIAQFLQALN